MIRKTDLLDSIRIASPCHASWDEMEGDERVRHCDECRLNVFNLSEMSREEAVKLIEERQGRLCVRLYRRQDGTVITRDCPKGLRAARRKAAITLAYSFGLVLSLFAIMSRQARAVTGLTDLASRIHDPKWRANLPSGMRSVLEAVDPIGSGGSLGSPMPAPLTGKIAVQGGMAPPRGMELQGEIAAPSPSGRPNK